MSQHPLSQKDIENGKDPAFEHIEQMIREATELPCGENKLARLLKTFTLSREIDFVAGMAFSALEAGKCYVEDKKLIEALNQLKMAETYFGQIAHSIGLYQTSQCLSRLHKGSLNFDFALDEAYKALRIAEKESNKIYRAEIHSEIASIYIKLEEYSKGLEHYQISLQLYTELNIQNEIAWMNFRIGTCYLQGGELDAALNHLEIARSYALQENQVILKQFVTSSLAEYYIKTKRFEKALEFYTIAIDAASAGNNPLNKASLLCQLGELHLIRNDLPKADISLQSALKICLSVEAQTPTQLVYKNLSALAEKQNNHALALEHYQKYIELCKVIQQGEINLKIKGIELKYDIEKLIRDKNQAEKNSYIKDQFLAGVSHEIRTPLHGILGMANLLLQTTKSAEEMEFINTIKLSATNLIRVFEDLFDFAKINSGEIELNEKEFSLQALLTDQLSRLNKMIHSKNVRTVLSADENIPDMLIGDETRLHTILNNILFYCAENSRKGTIRIKVDLLKVSDQLLRLRFNIDDDESNMPEERRKYLSGELNETEINFNHFYEGQSIGLVIVKQLIELQKGNWTIKKNEGSGTLFCFELPFKYKSNDLIHTESGNQQVLDLNDLSKFKLLLVEDNKLNQFLTQKILSKLGFSVDLSDDAAHALELISRSEYHTVLMDVNMPGINGYELTQLIRKTGNINSAVPIIALTAYTSPAEKEKAMEAGMNDYVTKPYSPNDLLSAILKQLGQKSNRVQTGIINTDNKTIEEVNKHLNALFKNDAKDIEEFINMLNIQLPLQLNALQQYIQKQNWEAVYLESHKIKSSIRILNVKNLVDLILLIETASMRKTNCDQIPALFEKLNLETRSLIASLIINRNIN
ncbi:MAG TPA: response regulator [Bacteroidia bacterium]|nr:response regulator [Bacteroidia bacterium]HNT80397.1 response regulator [Bacteroidia bacterium]